MSRPRERTERLKEWAAKLSPAPIALFYVQRPDEIEIRASGWYMRMTRAGEPIMLGHSAAAAEQYLRALVDGRLPLPTSVRKRSKKRNAA